MSYVNEIPELHGQNYGKWRQKLEIALALAEIDLAIIMSPLEELENPVRAQNEAGDAWAIRQKAHDIAWTKIENLACTLEYFKLQVPDDHQRYHFRWYKNDNSRMSRCY